MIRLKKKIVLGLVTVLLVGSYAYVYFGNTPQQVNRQATKTSQTIDLSGNYYTDTGAQASVSKAQNHWVISYVTADGPVSATFSTKWTTSGKTHRSSTKMKKSDGYTKFTIAVTYTSRSDITIKMADGNPDHQMTFSKEKSVKSSSYDSVLKGDLTPFVGTFSSDDFNQEIADSGFTYGGYQPDDYYHNRTSVFPAITKNGYWNGITSHGKYDIKSSDLPKKVDGYYEVHVYGVNTGAGDAQRQFYLVPPDVTGPDGQVASQKRVFEIGANQQLIPLTYQTTDWWKNYQKQATVADFDLAAINRGDYSSLQGTWKNGQGDTLIINSDGSTADGEKISATKGGNAKLPSLNMTAGNTGVAIYLFKIGVSNPYTESNDPSDTSKPRLTIGQNPGAFPADAYYYRQ